MGSIDVSGQVHFLTVVPIRRNSAEVVMKNVRPFSNSTLLRRLLEKLLTVPNNDVLVSTDCELAVETIQNYFPDKVFVHQRSVENSKSSATIDDVVREVFDDPSCSTLVDRASHIAVCQATVPLLPVDELTNFYGTARTSTSETCVSVTELHGSVWMATEIDADGPRALFESRVNRQHDQKTYLIENGAFTSTTKEFFRRARTRFNEAPTLMPVRASCAIDIDTEDDWKLAEAGANSEHLRIAIVAILGKSVGTGHIYRAAELQRGLALFGAAIYGLYLDEEHVDLPRQLGLFANPITRDELVHLPETNIILDILDIEDSLVRSLRDAGKRVITFENRNAIQADAPLTFNGLYSGESVDPSAPVFFGPQYFVLDERWRAVEKAARPVRSIRRVVVFMGGTDPSNLTPKVLEAIEDGLEKVEVMVVGREDLRAWSHDPAHANHYEFFPVSDRFPEILREADLFIGSAGQTMYQAAHLRVPTVVIAHSSREMEHVNTSLDGRVLCLGTEDQVDVKAMTAAINFLDQNSFVRIQMWEKCATADLSGGTARILQKVSEHILFNER